MDGNTATVQGIYEAFGRGDVAFILDQLADDVSWDEGIRETELPYLRPGRGKDHVLTFFRTLAEHVDFSVFEPGPLCAGGDTVAVPVREVGRNRVSGGEIPEDVVVHLWRFGDDGKVVSFRHVLDAAHHEAAARVAVA